MNNLSINITVSSLSVLTPIGTNTYQLVVKFFNSLGAPLDSPYIANSNTVSVVTTSTSFTINVPVVDGTYSISGVIIRAFANDSDDCCFAEGSFTISNTETGGGDEGNDLMLSGYFAQ